MTGHRPWNYAGSPKLSGIASSAECTTRAKATGECNDLNYHFGSASVAAWSMSIRVELERGPDAAERAAADVPRLAAVLVSAERRSRVTLNDGQAGLDVVGSGTAVTLLSVRPATRRTNPIAIPVSLVAASGVHLGPSHTCRPATTTPGLGVTHHGQGGR
jgi:hypothetical protein